VLTGTSGQEMFSDAMLSKYGSIENRYSVFELTNVDICIAHFVGLLGFYVINDILPLNVTTDSLKAVALSDMKDYPNLESIYST
jgi:hypothetical protein